MNKKIVLTKVTDDYEIGPSAVAANIDGNIIPMPSPVCYNMKEVIKNNNLVYNRGVADPQKQKLYEYEELLDTLEIPYKTNEVILDVISEMERKGLFM